MRTMLLSFKPEWYNRIKEGSKIFEYRRTFPDEEILANHYNIQEIARISGIGQSYGVEVSKGVKLSRFVELKKNQL